MHKRFFEVFPTLRVHRELHILFEETEVEKVTANTARTRYKVYLLSDHLIPKEMVDRMQREIVRQVFGASPAQVFILEQYHLSKQYDLEQLTAEYRASLLYEMEGFSPVLARLFAQGSIKAVDEENRIEITLPDHILAKEKAADLKVRIENIFANRLGHPSQVVVTLDKTKKPEHTEDATPSNKKEDVVEAIPVPSREEDPFLVGLPYIDVEETPEGKVVVTKMAQKKKTKHPFIYSNDPDVLYGRAFEGETIPLESILGEAGDVVVRGEVTGFNARAIKNEKSIVTFTITDYTDSIGCKLFLSTEDVPELEGYLALGSFIRVKGKALIDAYDNEVVIGPVTGIMKTASLKIGREDHYETKRIELHCHTKMSDMDGVSDCSAIVKRAYDWGMRAIAITDHGNVQSFPEAFRTRNELLEKENGKRKAKGLVPIQSEEFFKVIYGVECYLVDDLKKTVALSEKEDPQGSLEEGGFVVFDLETTGLSPVRNKIIEIGAVKIEDGRIVDRFSTFVDPQEAIPYRIQRLTNIDDSMVHGAETIETVLPRFLEFCKGARLVGHNVGFDIGFVKEKAKAMGIRVDVTTIDTEGIARFLLPGHARYTLDAVAKNLGVPLENHHRAVEDAEATAGIFLKEVEKLREQNVRTFAEVDSLTTSNDEIIKRLHTFHCILLAQNDTGRVNLYKMISDSHLKYFHTKPRVPKSELLKHRAGLLVGSACVMGELFQAVLENRGDEEIANIVNFYDYLEIQPRDNNRFLLDEKYRSRYDGLETEEDLLDLNRRIVELGETFGKPVVATGDVHFLDPEDEIYRTILQEGMGMGAREEEPAPLYLKTTDEMMEEFAYLGAEKTKEVVIDAPARIADSIEVIAPVRPDKCPPVIAHSDETLRDICYKKAYTMYGDPLPQIVHDRLEKELTSIITNGYSVMYIIAQKLVWKSEEDGYLVGSRGSVGSSLVATMAGITEVNPLPPHYYCPNCFYSDFDSEEVRSYKGKCGIDMPPKMCPRCGGPFRRDGFDIPFETFLGFDGDKEPDIDLNFSGEYQNKAHRYTEVIFGKGQTFKAGTIATIAEKTAYGFVKNYFEKRGIPKRKSEIERLLKGLVGVRRSTGQHPGGIVVLPLGEDINTFTPVQHPANDMKSDIITTHFDYHSIEHNLLKLDILGHDDPTMIRMLQDLTGLNPREIPLNDEKVMRLFLGTEALGITPEENGGIDLGILGIPEFGTRFVIGMVEDTRPTTVAELVRISGLSHGTNVWLDNAQYYIKNGFATLSTAICTRDDIMTYLIGEGVEKELSFQIMEKVRKGKGLSENMKDAMREAGVPEWYIESCLKIQYMFPKAHAAAYVMMALRIAYCKIYYPLAYYAAYFSIRATAFNYELMCRGQGKLLSLIDEYEHKADLSKKDQETLDDMYIVREMYARGIDFVPIDLYTVQATRFSIVGDQLMPSLTSIQNMGAVAAQSLVEAAKQGQFLSKDDLKNRTKVSSTLIDKMGELGILGEMPETNQISIFDFM
ncbi:MAG: PolC-type DNA polymerase III [Lachnospiraceae bacterium]|nr:PolC-type DNA polymerase III [Lachnospiraceae bacterium]